MEVSATELELSDLIRARNVAKELLIVGVTDDAAAGAKQNRRHCYGNNDVKNSSDNLINRSSQQQQQHYQRDGFARERLERQFGATMRRSATSALRVTALVALLSCNGKSAFGTRLDAIQQQCLSQLQSHCTDPTSLRVANANAVRTLQMSLSTLYTSLIVRNGENSDADASESDDAALYWQQRTLLWIFAVAELLTARDD